MFVYCFLVSFLLSFINRCCISSLHTWCNLTIRVPLTVSSTDFSPLPPQFLFGSGYHVISWVSYSIHSHYFSGFLSIACGPSWFHSRIPPKYLTIANALVFIPLITLHLLSLDILSNLLVFYIPLLLLSSTLSFYVFSL